MINRVYTVSENLAFGNLIEIETNISDKGLPIFEISGLISKSIDESKRRVVTSLENSGFIFPLKNILVNLSPANIQKNGTHYDLAIAVSIIKDKIVIPNSKPVFIGELSFDGSIREVDNIFYLAVTAIESGSKDIYLPMSSIEKLPKIEGINFFPISHLRDLNNLSELKPYHPNKYNQKINNDDKLYSKIIGNYNGKKAIAYSLIGKHSILIQGPPGVGKSMLAKSMVDLSPSLSFEDFIHVSKIYSYSGISREKEGFNIPFRSPHPLSSYSSMFGSYGGRLVVGEIGLANKGILFLDEFPEFNRLVIEGLRGPLEDKKINLSRAGFKTEIESDFILVCTSNPCKCGYYNHSKIGCKCSPFEIRKYQSKLSGPILDRIDIKLTINENNKLNSSEEKDYSIFEYSLFKDLISQKNLLRKKLLLVDDCCILDPNRMYNLIVQKYFPTKIWNLFINELKNTSISDRLRVKLVNLIFTISLFNNRELISFEDVIEGISLSIIKN